GWLCPRLLLQALRRQARDLPRGLRGLGDGGVAGGRAGDRHRRQRGGGGGAPRGAPARAPLALGGLPRGAAGARRAPRGRSPLPSPPAGSAAPAPARAARAVRGTRAGGGGRRPAALHARARVRRRRRRGAARPRPVEGGDGATAGRPRAHPARSLARLAVRTLGLLGLVLFLLVVTAVASPWIAM